MEVLTAPVWGRQPQVTGSFRQIVSSKKLDWSWIVENITVDTMWTPASKSKRPASDDSL
jgi:hypothetical protein